jgi:hypothetical protein
MDSTIRSDIELLLNVLTLRSGKIAKDSLASVGVTEQRVNHLLLDEENKLIEATLISHPVAVIVNPKVLIDSDSPDAGLLSWVKPKQCCCKAGPFEDTLTDGTSN